ncbi:MAG: ABC transporter permease [Methylophilaceae bacterium]|nr:ABC transporter permease [Methylophilaceae bacterium]
MKNWINRHLQVIQQVLVRMRLHGWSTLMMCGVIGVTLCLPSLFYIATDNLNRLASDIQTQSPISLFLKLNATQAEIQSIERQLKGDEHITSYHLVTKDQAWQKMQKTGAGNTVASNIVNTLDKNPLPDAFFITPASNTPEAISQLQSSLQALNGVDKALIDSQWIKRLNGLLQLGNKMVLVLASLLAFALVAVIGNTIRMQILTQLAEIEVSQLIGATKSFIRCPFLYAGALYGLGGGLIACLLLWTMVSFFNSTVVQIAAEYGSQFAISNQSLVLNLFIVLTATAIGWLAAYFAVNSALVTYH